MSVAGRLIRAAIRHVPEWLDLCRVASGKSETSRTSGEDSSGLGRIGSLVADIRRGAGVRRADEVDRADI